MSQKFCNILVVRACLQRVYHVTEAVQAVVEILSDWQYRGSWCADPMCIKLLRVPFSKRTDQRIIREFTFYEIELVHNAMKAIKNICSVKRDDAVYQNIIITWLKKFH